ncbi:TRAP-type C4-dicarboxylate transport system substrate-binding protein [Burkholderia ambifaria]|nr:TRAP-type C4-dicarboxylate transport system substrate-binding protein [Burkholderia ambifaria]
MHEVNRRSGGTIEIVPLYQVSGIKSADVPAAVHEGQLDAGDAFGGALAGMDPIFSLSSLPFITATTEDARRLAELARPLYKAAFNRRGLHLLYVTPWPATGLWSNKPVVDIEALRALTVRTYDATSRRVIQEAGAKAENLSFTDVMPRLADGSITAVLSSGDGGAGRKLWKWLPNFTAVNYAMPLSFAVVNAHMYAALPPEQRQVVDEAAVATEDQQWARVQMRQVENTRRMQDAGVRIVQVPSLDVRLAMRGAAAQTVSEWMQRAGPDATSVLEHYECLSVRAAGHLPRTDR